MAMLPKLKIKALVSFPANVFGGTGISIDKTAGNFTIDLNYSEFAFQGTLPTGSNVLVWDPVANVYTLVPPSATGGISDAPTDGKVYGRKSAAWVDAWASPVLTGNPTAPTPAPLDNDTSVATTAFVTAAISSIPAGTPPPAPATAIPLADGAAAVGVSLKYAREDHVHPAGAAGSGDVVGPSGAVDSNFASFNTTTGKLIKDSGSAASSFATPSSVVTAISNAAVRYDLPQGLNANQQAQGRANIGVFKKNYIINGAMMVSQENGTTAGTTNLYYPVDQWASQVSLSGGAVKFEQTNAASTPVGKPTPAGSPNRLRTTVTTAQATIGSSYVFLTQKIEGVRTADLLFGTTAAKAVIIQMGVNGPAGTYTVWLANGAQTVSTSGSFTIAAGEAAIDVVKSIVISSGLTSGAFPVDNTAGVFLQITLAAASQANLLAANGNIFELFDVSLTEGTVAPPFVVPDYANELRLCQRYWTKSYNYLDRPGTATAQPGAVSGIAYATSGISANAVFKVKMRGTPTMTLYSYNGTQNCWSASATNSDTATGTPFFIGESSFATISTSGLTVGAGYFGHYVANARL